MAIFHVQPLEIPLKQTFKQASSVRSTGESIWVEAKDGNQVGLGEGCPRQYVTGETISSSLEWINSILPTLEKIETFEQLNTFVNQNESELDLHPAAWCGLELALLDLLARQENTTPEPFFELNTVENTSFAYTAVLSDSTIEKFNKRLVQFREMRFTDFKLKISGDWGKDRAKFESINQHLATIPLRLRLDANNLWGHDIDSAISYFQKVSHPLLGIEEPFSTANFEGMKKLQEHSGIPIILDESGANQAQLKQAHALGIDCILNIKISKAGGVIRSLALIDTAKELGIPIIIGAHVGETSILTRAAMLIASYTAESLVAIEGGFGELLIERDQVEPVLQLGVGGSIKLADLTCDAIGWGLRQRI